MSFKDFVHQRINYFVVHFLKQAVLLSYDGDVLKQIDLSFQTLTDLYLQQDSPPPQGPLEVFRISDSDLILFLNALSACYEVSLNLAGQNISDETILRLADLYEQGKCKLSKLNFDGNVRITQVSIGRLGQQLRHLQIQELDLHQLKIGESGINRIIEGINFNGMRNLDLGLIGNSSLKYLAKALEHSHRLECLAFGENKDDPWKEGKNVFQTCMRKCQSSRHIIAVNLYLEDVVEHYELVGELNVLCKKYRSLKIDERENQFKAASLNPNHNKYYDPDNHSLNAYKFSVKSYLNNVFGSLLDEALYFIEKERRNSLREEAIFSITKEPINKIILEDICSAEGSIVVLTKYLLNKIKSKEG